MQRLSHLSQSGAAIALGTWLAVVPAVAAWADANFPPPMLPAAPNAVLPNAFNNIALQAGAALPDIARRMPGAGNDAAHGYPVNINPSYATAYWRYGGQVFQQGSSNAGYPQWAPLSVGAAPLPGNATSATLYGAWSTDLVVSGYAGHLWQVERASDSTTLNIDPVSGTTRPNTAPIGTFCNGTSCKLSEVYDQSGNANNCVQATFANMMLVTVDPDGSVHFSAQQPTIAAQTQLTCSGVSLTKNAMSIAFVGRTRGAPVEGSSGPAPLVQIGSNSAYADLIQWYQHGVTFYNDGGLGSTNFSGYLANRDTVVIATSGASAHGVTTDGFAPYSASAFGATALSGMTLGHTTSGQAPAAAAQQVDIKTVLLWASALSNADQQAARSALYIAHNVTPQARCSIVGIGESVLWGQLQDAGQGIIDNLRNLLPSAAVIFNRASPGQQVGPVGTSGTMLYDYVNNTGKYAALYNSSAACNIALINPGLNDIANGRTVAQVEADIATLVADAAATGFTPVVLTEISRASYDTQHDQLNTWLRAGNSGARIIDVALDPLLGADGANANTAIFQGDGIHLTDAGAAEEAGLIASGLIGQNLVSY